MTTLKRLSNPDSGSLDIVYGEDWNTLVTFISEVGTYLIPSVSPTLGTNGSLGSESTLYDVSNTDYNLVLLGLRIQTSGVGSETITIRITSYFSDDTSTYVDFSTATDVDWKFPPIELLDLVKDGVSIKKMTVQASTSASSTTATVTVTPLLVRV